MTTKLQSDLIKSLLHTAEIAIGGGVILTLVYMFRDDADIMAATKDALLNIIPVALAAFAMKFNRTTDKTPGGDYVNEIK